MIKSGIIGKLVAVTIILKGNRINLNLQVERILCLNIFATQFEKKKCTYGAEKK